MSEKIIGLDSGEDETLDRLIEILEKEEKKDGTKPSQNEQ